MTGPEFTSWRLSCGLQTAKDAADALGYSVKRIRQWESDNPPPVPPAVRYAMAAIYHRLGPWGEA